MTAVGTMPVEEAVCEVGHSLLAGRDYALCNRCGGPEVTATTSWSTRML